MAAKFLRGNGAAGRMGGQGETGTWLSGHVPPRGNWKLYVDRVIEV